MAKSTDILTLIEADHRKVEELLSEIEKTKGAKKKDLFRQIYQEMTLHAQAEELVFYPAMQEYEQTAALIEEAEEEHNIVKILLEEMLSIEPSDENFQMKMRYLLDNIAHHVEEEESEIFEAVRACMDEKQLQELGKEFQTTKSNVESDIKAVLSRK